MSFAALADTVLGPCIRCIPGKEKTLFLTFDDGPALSGTPEVLQILERFEARATFFFVAEKALGKKELVRAVLAKGNAVGNHSWDHGYGMFFLPQKQLKASVERAEKTLREIIGAPTVGFRSPAGIRTPPLKRVLRELGLPLIHWKIRFFDTQFDWTTSKAIASLKRTPGGSIILLHDPKRGQKKRIFLETLANYLKVAKEQGYTFEALPRTSLTL